MVQIIGLTGGIACGKSTISKMVKSYKEGTVLVVDADRVAHEVMEGEEVKKKVVRRFGEGVVQRGGKIDREKVGEIVFADAGARRDLGKIMQSPIFTGIVREILYATWKQYDLIVLDIPLLFETKIFTYICEATIVASIPHDLQLQRLITRNGYTRIHAEQRISAAMPTSQKERLATHVLCNDGTLEQTEARLMEILATVRAGKKLFSPIRLLTAFVLLLAGGLATVAHKTLF